MKVLYGTPLPPGVDAPTRGELRIRIEKLMLKDDLISTTETLSGGLRPYSIPVEHCAVSPLFFGEQQPSCQCVPSTPRQRRGVAQLVYPLKTFDGQFAEYIRHMSASALRGVQIVIFVPSSYSGRSRSIRVGKSIVSLGALKPSSPISGWFTILSDGTTRLSENSGEVSSALLEVGKVKLTFGIAFFSRAPPSPTFHSLPKSSPSRSEAVQSLVTPAAAAVSQPPVAHHGVLEKENTNDSPSIVFLDKKNDTEHEVFNVAKHQQKQKQLLSSDGDGGVYAPVNVEVANALPSQNHPVFSSQKNPSSSKISVIPAVDPMTESHQRSAISQLLLHGSELRERMNKAVAAPARLDEFGTSTGFMHSHFVSPNRYVPLPVHIPPPSGAEHLHGGPPAIPHESIESSATSLSDDSEDGEDEKDEIGVENKVAESNMKHNSKNSALQTEVSLYRDSFHPDAVYEDGYVEVDLYRIAFSSGPATLGMEEMRIGVRLSKDVKTDEPIESYSSYVHRVPLARGADHHIVLGFHVRVFSEGKSRMVVSFYRVRSEPESNPPGEQLLPPQATAQRVLVGETLLGMCIVGLHAQSRDILLHDPITGEDPTQAHLVVRIRSRNASVAKSGSSDAIQIKNCSNLVLTDSGETLFKSSNTAGVVSTVTQEERNEKDTDHVKKHPDTRKDVLAASGRPTFARTSRKKKKSKNKKKRDRLDDSEDAVALRISRASRLSPSSFSSSMSSSSSRTTTSTSSLERGKKEESVNASRSADIHLRNASVNVLPHRVDEGHPAAMSRPTKGDDVVRTNSADAIKSRLVDDSIKTVAMKNHVVPGKTLALVDTRFRMHVCIRAGKEFPMVAVDQEDSIHAPMVTLLDQMENGVRSAITANGASVLVDNKNRIFQPPTTFFVIEDFFSGADLRMSATGAVPDWFVEAAVFGEGDRTRLVSHSQNPNYDYEAVLSLPRDGVFLRHTVLEETLPAQCPAPCLREMRLTLWHFDGNEMNNHSAGIGTEGDFWAKTAILGECRIDLRSLRFLKVLDGWYRINAVDKVEVVGYVRASVRMM